MSLLGKGFGGPRLFNRPAATAGGAYVYGLIFALGWTTCVGPILGSILTLLLAEGSSVGGVLSIAAGGGLVLVYVVGLGLPIFVLVSAIAAAGPANRVSRILRGRGWDVQFAGRTLYLHSTQIASGVMLIALGILLMTGEMTAISERLVGSSFSQQVVRLEGWLNDLIE